MSQNRRVPTYHSDHYRAQVLAEIIDSGHAAEIDEQAFQAQVLEWALALDGIPAKSLLPCFASVKRNRETRGVEFEDRPLCWAEMLVIFTNS